MEKDVKKEGDLISRHAAIKAICEDGTWLESQGCTDISMAERKQRDADILGELPSAQPEQRKGEWIDVTKTGGAELWKCSECGELELEDSYFCPNCGARMEEE